MALPLALSAQTDLSTLIAKESQWLGVMIKEVNTETRSLLLGCVRDYRVSDSRYPASDPAPSQSDYC